MFSKAHSLLIYLLYVIAPGTTKDCLKRISNQDDTVELNFNVTVVDEGDTFDTYQITRINNGSIHNLLTVAYRAGNVHDNSSVAGVESIGNASAGDLSIRIPSMNISFEGTYTLSRSTDIKCIELEFRVSPRPPVIHNSDHSGNIIGIEDNDVTLVCSSTGGYPKPTMAWYRTNNQTATLANNTDQPKRDDRNYTLEYTFKAVRADDGETFLCQSSYDPPTPDHLSMKAETKLILSLKPSTPMLRLNTPLRENSNKMVIAECSSDGFKPDQAQLTLKLGGKTVAHETNCSKTTNGTFIVKSKFISTIDKKNNGKLLTCVVNHTALDAPLRTQQKLDIQFAPETATLSGNSPGIVADEKKEITLTCKAGSSNPPSNITWYVNKRKVERNSPIQQTSGKYNGHDTSLDLVLKAVRAIDGFQIFCEVHNVVNGNNHLKSDTITLDLRFHPIAELSDGAPIVEGQAKEFHCHVHSKPPSNITWYHRETKLSTEKETYIIPVVNRSHAGTYKCKATNGYPPDGTNQTNLIVHYAPDVEVTTTNVTVNDSSTRVRCSPSGIPADYTFSEWQHIWPDVGTVVHKNGLGTSQTLTLSQLTYEYSGIYKCSVSNGIEESLNQNAGHGEAYLKVETYPIITADGDFKVPGRLNENMTVTIAFYSNVRNNSVECFIGNTTHACSTVFVDEEINLHLFDKTIQTSGTLAHISFSINSGDQFGVFNIKISNSIGYSERAVEVIPEGPPQIPGEVSIEETQSNAVILSWVPGFHGGFNQTFVIEYSNDGQTWLSENTIDIQGGLTLTRINGTVSNLQSGTLYFMRLMSRNEKGNSGYTQAFSVATDLIPERDALNLVPAIIGGVTAAVVITVALVVLVLARRRYRKHADYDTEQSRKNLHDARIHDDSGMEMNQANVSTDDFGVVPSASPGSSDIYAQVNKNTKKGQNASGDNTYAVVNKSKPKAEGTSMRNKIKEKVKRKEKKEKKVKKDKLKEVDVYKNVHDLDTYGNIGPNDVTDDGNVYENQDVTKLPKRNLNNDGLLYVDLEFTNDTKGQRKPIIHGLENTTDYIQVDFTKKADPLPDDDDEGTQP